MLNYINYPITTQILIKNLNNINEFRFDFNYELRFLYYTKTNIRLKKGN